jgi:hypothetical protein
MGTTKETSFREKLIQVQSELKAPKNQTNKFGGYQYRNCEDILESLKPLLLKHDLCMSISDDIVEVGSRIYVKATVKVFDDFNEQIVSAFAREDEGKKGFDLSQLTGATSSYARKYALNGMFLIDDTKDSDATNTHGKESSEAPTQPKPSKIRISDIKKVKTALSGANRVATINQLVSSYVITPAEVKELELTAEESKLIELTK